MTQSINCERIGQSSYKSKKLDKFKEILNKHSMTILTLCGVALGIILGTSLRFMSVSTEMIHLISYPGEIFLRILQCLILPLLLSCLITVSASINPKLSGKITVNTIIYFAITSTVSSVIAIALALLFQSGTVSTSASTLATKTDNDTKTKFMDSMLDLGRNFFPDNLFQALFQQVHTVYTSKSNSSLIISRNLAPRSGPSTLGLVTFCILFGSVSNTIGSKGKLVKEFFEGIFEVLMKLTTAVMWLNGVGMCSLIAGQLLRIANMSEVFSQLAMFSICVTVAIAFHQIIFLPFIYFVYLRKNPFKFFSKLSEPWITSFGVSSSAISLPVATQCLISKAKCDERIAKFVLSLGVTLNNNGTAMFLSISTVYIARMNGISLDFTSIIMTVITATSCSMSMPSVPGGSLLVLMIVLTAVDVSTQIVSLLFAIDWILDRLRTTSNVTANCFAAAIMEHRFKNELQALDLDSQTSDKNHQTV